MIWICESFYWSCSHHSANCPMFCWLCALWCYFDWTGASWSSDQLYSCYESKTSWGLCCGYSSRQTMAPWPVDSLDTQPLQGAFPPQLPYFGVYHSRKSLPLHPGNHHAYFTDSARVASSLPGLWVWWSPPRAVFSWVLLFVYTVQVFHTTLVVKTEF